MVLQKSLLPCALDNGIFIKNIPGCLTAKFRVTDFFSKWDNLKHILYKFYYNVNTTEFSECCFGQVFCQVLAKTLLLHLVNLSIVRQKFQALTCKLELVRSVCRVCREDLRTDAILCLRNGHSLGTSSVND